MTKQRIETLRLNLKVTWTIISYDHFCEFYCNNFQIIQTIPKYIFICLLLRQPVSSFAIDVKRNKQSNFMWKCETSCTAVLFITSLPTAPGFSISVYWVSSALVGCWLLALHSLIGCIFWGGLTLCCACLTGLHAFNLWNVFHKFGRTLYLYINFIRCWNNFS